MAKPKVFVFAPADPTGEAHKMLIDAGCELILGQANWDTPQGNNDHGSGLHPGLMWGTRAVIAALKGEVLDNVYNKEVIDQWKSKYGGKSLI